VNLLRLRDLSGAIRQALLLLGLSLVLSAVLWAVRPDRLPLQADPQIYTLDLPAPLISVDEGLRIYEDGTRYFVDTREGDADGRAAIPGSFVIREQSLTEDLAEIGDFLYPEDALVLYGAGHPLPVAAVAARLQSLGFEDLVILQGGLEAWQRADGPLRTPEAAE
jgi:rhodanese-related sulfurtransferase